MNSSEMRAAAEQVWREIHADAPELLDLALAWMAAEYGATETSRVCPPTAPRNRDAQARAKAANRAYLQAKHGMSNVFALLG